MTTCFDSKAFKPIPAKFFAGTVIHKKDRNAYPTCIGDRLFSIRKLQT